MTDMSTKPHTPPGSPQKPQEKPAPDVRAVALKVLEKRWAVFAGLAKR
ncbi:hypothetical protein [Deinococcus sp. DB0503]|nr:hypothetical protein [Deinococcus sp. DB0503]